MNRVLNKEQSLTVAALITVIMSYEPMGLVSSNSTIFGITIVIDVENDIIELYEHGDPYNALECFTGIDHFMQYYDL